MNVKRLWIGAGVAVASFAGAAAISHGITKTLIRVALHRSEPRAMTRMKKKWETSPKAIEKTTLQRKKAKELEENVSETIEILSHDGETLIGHWVPCENARRVIIAMHGWRSSWSKDFGGVSEFWHNSGCGVLYVEQRAQNNSTGEYMTFGLMERYDCLDWIRFVNEITGGALPIYLSGISMGASTVLMASELHLPENVHGIIADCGFTSPHAIWRHVLNNRMHLFYGIRGRLINRVYLKKFKVGINGLSTLNALANSETPVLFIHGAADRFVPVEMTYENYQACAAPKRLLIVPGARHAMSYFVDPEAYERATEEFFTAFD